MPDPIFDRSTPLDVLVKDAIAKEMAIKGSFITRYLAETGAKLRDTRVVEQTHADGVTKSFWCEPIVKLEKPQQHQKTALDAVKELMLDITRKQAAILHLITTL